MAVLNDFVGVLGAELLLLGLFGYVRYVILVPAPTAEPFEGTRRTRETPDFIEAWRTARQEDLEPEYNARMRDKSEYAVLGGLMLLAARLAFAPIF